MLADETFQDLLKRVRAGEQEAAAELVRQCTPEIRRIVRMRLTDGRLRRVLDSLDVCQSVLANFFVRASAGQFELETPEQLLKLLAVMARNRVLSHVQKQQAGRRDQRRMCDQGAETIQLQAGSEETPSQIVSAAELMDMARSRMTDEERRLAELRSQGQDWAAIAAAAGCTQDAARKKLARAMDRVLQELGIDEGAPAE